MYRIRKYSLFITFGLMVLIGIIFINRENEKEMEVSSASPDFDPLAESSTEEDETNEASNEIAVDVKGAVLDPGVYHVEESARVYDAIELAGGFLKEADEKQINLAERIQDEMFVYVPAEGEEDTPNPGASGVPGGSANPGNSDKDMIRVNQASLAELETLNGIGPSKAQTILDYIEENGPLKESADILEISGIGEKTLENFEDQIIVP